MLMTPEREWPVVNACWLGMVANYSRDQVVLSAQKQYYCFYHAYVHAVCRMDLKAKL